MTATAPVAHLVARLIADPIGNYPAATVACFDPTTDKTPNQKEATSRKLDEPRTIAFLERLAAAGAPALLIGSSTGHGHLRTVEALHVWFAVAARAKIGGAVLSALLRPEDGPELSRELALSAASHGFAVAFVRPGRDLPKDATDEQIAANIRPAVIAAAEAGLAVGLYSIPDVSGVPLTPTAASLVVHSLRPAKLDRHVVAIKVTEASYARSTALFLAAADLAHLKIVQGWDPHLAKALLDGPDYDAQRRQRCGVTSGPMSFAIHQYVHLLSAAEQGDWDEVAEAQAAVTALFQAMQDDPAKFADLQRAKFIMGLGQPLLGTVTTAQVEKVLAALEALPRRADRSRLARSLDLLGDGPYHDRLAKLA
jgi:dihydrodipicolinate synthase/N-acetylneuraminate lyase